MKRTVVLGANGLLGTHLVPALANRGVHVIAVDRYRDEPRFSGHPRITKVRKDTDLLDSLNDVLTGADAVFDLVSKGTPATKVDNVTGVINLRREQFGELLQLVADAGVREFHLLSTGGAMFGDTPGHIFTEDQQPAPLSAYAREKLALEESLASFAQTHPLEQVIYRGGNFWGLPIIPRQKHRIIATTLRHIAVGEPAYRLGDGSMVRDYIHAADAAEMVATIATAPAREHVVYNIGTGVGTTVNQVFDQIRQVIGRDFEIIDEPQPESYVHGYALDISRYIDEFGQPTFIDFRTGITQMWGELTAN